MTKKNKTPRYIKAAIVAAIIGVLNFWLSSSTLLKWQYIAIISGIYFIWEAFIEPLVLGEEKY